MDHDAHALAALKPVGALPEAATAAQDGTRMRVGTGAGRIECCRRTFSAQPFPPFLEDLIRAGGLVPWVRAQLGRAGRMT